MRAGAAVAVVALTLVAAAGGFAAGRATAPDVESSSPGAASTAERADPSAERPARSRARAVAEPTLPSSTQPDPTPSPTTSTDGARVTVALSTPAGADALRERIAVIAGGEIDPARAADAAAAARGIRTAALANAENADVAAVRSVADDIVRERAFAVDAARGGTMEMLRTLPKGTHRFGVVGDASAFAKHFARRESGPTLDGSTLDRAAPMAHGTTVQFPAGVHAFDVARYQHAKEFPRDLVVAGVGMDATLVRLNELASQVEVTNLTFRDCTVDCGDDYLTDLRGDPPITLRLERCRVVGFDTGAGGSVMLGARRAAFYATDCRFEAGYGRTDPGHGNLFDVRGALLARLERCTFRGPFDSVYDRGATSTYVFAECRFERMASGFGQAVDTPPEGVRFERCVVAEPLAAGERPGRRPLSDFNPSWPSKPR